MTEHTFKERLLFTLASAAAAALLASLARRAIAKAWGRATGREPPRELPLFSTAGRRAGDGAAAFLLERIPGFKRLRI